MLSAKGRVRDEDQSKDKDNDNAVSRTRIVATPQSIPIPNRLTNDIAIHCIQIFKIHFVFDPERGPAEGNGQRTMSLAIFPIFHIQSTVYGLYLMIAETVS